ncbi:E3 ubiquitin-protein ligase SINA-like 10 [Amaranthus tricolor]|uniref:E3 ubiquitin-protein ligase SINA-like 10 n=1 Tax=Amaranthus tricolor TaxID=29722 RepID=UPI00258DD237|nr:E3 ubiquitin-protein ligase SINA-like 10 [Amaranthus tricolor]
MAKFSIFNDEDEDDEEFIIPSPKRRRTYTPQSTSALNHDHQQQSSSSQDEHNTDSSVGSTKSSGPVSIILSDPDVFDCPICFCPLTIPVFQCDNGHIACSTCCNNLVDKCPSCCGKIGNNRCRAIEKVIESVQVSCCYLRYGCKETINYCRKHEHEEKCLYAPCLCPFRDCLFRGSSKRLTNHMRKEHAGRVIRFRYNSIFSISPQMDEKVLVLQEDKDGTLFILSHGSKIVVRCFNPTLSNGRFSYDLVLRRGSTSLKFQSFTHCTAEKYSDPPSEDYVLIPAYFYLSGGRAKLEICIWSPEKSRAQIT